MDNNYIFVSLTEYNDGRPDNLSYRIETDLAPEDSREFARFVRRSIENIMDDVKLHIVVRDKFDVEISGKHYKRFVKTAQRLGRKAQNQAKSAAIRAKEIGDKLVRDYHQESNRGSFESAFDAMIGACIGSLFSPEEPVQGAYLGALIGLAYNPTVNFLGKASRFVGRYLYHNVELKRRYPLIKNADSYSKFGRTIEKGFVNLRY